MIKLKEITHFGARTLDSMFGEVPFGEWDEIRALIKSNPEKESDTYYEEQFLDLIKRWTMGVDLEDIGDELYNEFDVIKRAADKFPDIFRPKTIKGTTLYRGLKNASLYDNLVDMDTTKDDFSPVNINGTKYWKYKNSIKYHPRNKVQSWTSSKSVANFFARRTGTMLVTKQNEDFYFNQKLLHIIYGARYEYEVLHFGKDYNFPVFLLIDDEYYTNKFVYG